MTNKAAVTINKKYDYLMSRIKKIDPKDLEPAIPLDDFRSVINKFRDHQFKHLLSTNNVADAVTSIASVASAFGITQYSQTAISKLDINTLKELTIFYTPMALKFFQKSLNIVINKLMLKDLPKVKKIKAKLVDKFEEAILKIRDDVDSHNLFRAVARLSDLLTPVNHLYRTVLRKQEYTDAKKFLESLYINATISVMFTAMVTIGNIYIEETKKKHE